MGIRLLSLDLRRRGLNGRPICSKWQLSGHLGCRVPFCVTGSHNGGRGCASNSNNIKRFVAEHTR